MSEYNLPTPKTWDRFEDFVWGLFTRIHKNPNLQRFGRSGQKQFGVDIAGPTRDGFIGIQCKHHDQGDIKSKEIDDEVKKSEGFRPPLSHYFIATSAPRDTKIHTYVNTLSETRKAQGKYGITIYFWEDLEHWLIDYKDLIHKYYPTIQPQLEDITVPGLGEPNRVTASVYSPSAEGVASVGQALAERGVSLSSTSDVTLGEGTLVRPALASLSSGDALESDTIRSIVATALRECSQLATKVDPYRLSIGVSTFPDRRFANIVDLDIQWAHLLSGDVLPVDASQAMAHAIEDVRAVIADAVFDRELTIYLQTRLTAAFIIGWAFRKVTGFRLKLVSGGQVWTTDGVSHVDHGLSMTYPEVLNQVSDELAVALNISRDIGKQVHGFVASWSNQPYGLLQFSLGRQISTAAHALAVAQEIARQIKQLVDQRHFKHLHLFGAVPAALAALISYHLNALCPLTLYFSNEAREFEQAGTITY